MINIQIAKPVAKKLKICLYGASGTGKTLAALTFPRVLMIDAESGSDLYAGRPGIPEFHRVRCKTLAEVNEVIAAVEADKGKTWDTLVIDPITVLYDVEKNVGSANNSKDMTFKSWGKVNNRMTALYNRLTGLDVHVVIIAREAIEYAGEGQDLRKVGVKPEADKKMVYMMDFVVRLKTDHTAEVEKSRGYDFGAKGALAKADWSVFAPIANLYVTGETQTYEDDETAAERESDSLQDREVSFAFMTYWRGQSLSDADVLKALKVSRLSLWTAGRKAADEVVTTYIKAMVSNTPATLKNPPNSPFGNTVKVASNPIIKEQSSEPIAQPV